MEIEKIEDRVFEGGDSMGVLKRMFEYPLTDKFQKLRTLGLLMFVATGDGKSWPKRCAHLLWSFYQAHQFPKKMTSRFGFWVLSIGAQSDPHRLCLRCLHTTRPWRLLGGCTDALPEPPFWVGGFAPTTPKRSPFRHHRYCEEIDEGKYAPGQSFFVWKRFRTTSLLMNILRSRMLLLIKVRSETVACENYEGHVVGHVVVLFWVYWVRECKGVPRGRRTKLKNVLARFSAQKYVRG